MKPSATLAASIIGAGLLLAAGCGFASTSGSGSSADHTKNITWDLRKPADIKTLGLQENTVDLPDVNVSITLSDGEVYSAQHVYLMIDGDLHDPTRITTIRVGLGAQTLDQAYQTAKDLGARWRIPAHYADIWYKDAKALASYSGGGAGRSELPGGNSVGLFMPISGDFSKPVYPEFEIDSVNAASPGKSPTPTVSRIPTPSASRTPTAPTSE